MIEYLFTPWGAAIVGGLNLAHAVHAYSADERANRKRWSRAVVVAALEPETYRHVERRLAHDKAPALVRGTAFACLFLGPIAVVVAFFPAILLSGAVLRQTGNTTFALTETTLLAYRLGPLLLARDRKVSAAVDSVAPLLRWVGGAMAALALVVLAGGRVLPLAAWILFGIGSVVMLLSASMTWTMRRWRDLFPELEPLAPAAESFGED